MNYEALMGIEARVWGVVDPLSPMGDFWLHAFGTDAVELRSNRPFEIGSGRFVQVKASALGPAMLAHYSEFMASHLGCQPIAVTLDSLYGNGINLDAGSVHITDDPDAGREFWAMYHESEGC